MAQQQMILPRALLDADEQFVVFVDQRIHERLVIGWQQRDQKGESGMLRQLQRARDLALALFAFLPRGRDDARLRS